ncbi:hypothetical protein [Shewanella carassii]|uniref:hypothetical protein n=1 Tax=Shewanella carassii TaxID=1987584 RepID=UPI00130001B3|nr:hypothetical protein [Shewanella carassii]
MRASHEKATVKAEFPELDRQIVKYRDWGALNTVRGIKYRCNKRAVSASKHVQAYLY